MGEVGLGLPKLLYYTLRIARLKLYAPPPLLVHQPGDDVCAVGHKKLGASVKIGEGNDLSEGRTETDEQLMSVDQQIKEDLKAAVEAGEIAVNIKVWFNPTNSLLWWKWRAPHLKGMLMRRQEKHLLLYRYGRNQ